MNALVLVSLLLMQIVGGQFAYVVEKGDSLTSIGARFGVDARVIAEGNGLQSGKLVIGQQLQIDNRHIVPPSKGVAILVNVPQRMLFYLSPDRAADGYPIAAGRRSWKTALGEFKVIQTEENPTWDVPISIQNEMRRSGKPVLTRVPPSPENPLGHFWIGLNVGGIGIHGTNAPSSIYGLATHGCIRLSPENIRTLFSSVSVGTLGRIIYEPVLVARVENDIFVEAHPDAYRMGRDPLPKIVEAARNEGFLDSMDLALVNEVIRRRDGIARNVTRAGLKLRSRDRE
jgi:L,D-transpeptidase ErfK/SrfK